MTPNQLAGALSFMQVHDLRQEDYWAKVPGYYQKPINVLSYQALFKPGCYLLTPSALPNYKIIFYLDPQNTLQSDNLEIIFNPLMNATCIKILALGKNQIRLAGSIPDMLSLYYPFLNNPIDLTQ